MIKCNTIKYRQGYIEVCADIHKDSINIETWNINPDMDIASLELSDDLIGDEDVSGNTELELPLQDAEELLRQLSEAISTVRKKGDVYSE